MAEVPLAALQVVASQLDELEVNYAFTGGSIVGLLLDYPELNPVRPTDDLDVIIEVLTQRDYSKLEERLRALGFEHDMTKGAPICRWNYRNLTVDIMPADGAFMGLNTNLFPEALASAILVKLNNVSIRVVSPVAFLVTKIAAFMDRGYGDFYASQDLEDIVAIVDGRNDVVREVAQSDKRFRKYIGNKISSLLKHPDFKPSLPGHLPPDTASQMRLPSLISKFQEIAVI